MRSLFSFATRKPALDEMSKSVEVVPDGVMRSDPRTKLNRLCDVSDWRLGRFLEILGELREVPLTHRKQWEYAICIWGLEQLGCVTPESTAIAVGAGYERPLYYFANRIARMVATDIYEGGGEGRPEMLTNPEQFAPFEYRREALEVMQMDGCDLRFDEGTFDFAFCLSSIEHFGSRENIVRAMKEMERVLKPGGVVCITTELILNQTTHEEYFTADEIHRYLIDSTSLELVDPDLDLRISESLLLHPIDLRREKILHVAPHIVLTENGVIWTSLSLFFRKPPA